MHSVIHKFLTVGPVVRFLIIIKKIKTLTYYLWRHADVIMASAMNTARDRDTNPSIPGMRAVVQVLNRLVLARRVYWYWSWAIWSPESPAATKKWRRKHDVFGG